MENRQNDEAAYDDYEPYEPGAERVEYGEYDDYDDPEPFEKPMKPEPAGRLTPKLMLQLAAPHTWSASIIPVFLAVCLAVGDTHALSVVMALVLLLISILLQSAVNTINDYFDYVKGADTLDNQKDSTDAVLVYNDIKPNSARNLALSFVGVAFALGIYIIVRAGWIPLVIALIGVAIVYLYSGGKTPISYLPIGELVSGFVMGGLITLASYQALTLRFSWDILLYAMPIMIGIALIMFTNNTCDIEQDVQAKRKTLPVLIGHHAAVILYRVMLIVWLCLIAVLVVFHYPRGWVLLPFLVAAYPQLMALFKNPFLPSSRQGGMAQITSLNVVLGLLYGAAVLMSTAAYLTL